MGKYTKISADAFQNMQLDAGVILNTFDPSKPTEPSSENIVCATTGGIKVDCVPTYSDLGEDVDNVPNNMKEFKHLDSWEAKIGFTALDITAETIRLALGAADATGSDYVKTADTDIVDGKTYYTRSGTSPNYTYTKVASPAKASLSDYYEKTPDNKVVPRNSLNQSDFSDLWWVGDLANGGFAAAKLLNGLSTSGVSLQSTKNGKNQLACEITGHVSIESQTTMPMEFYVIPPIGA